MKRFVLFSSILILSFAFSFFRPVSNFEEVFRLIEQNAIGYFDKQLATEIDTLTESGKNAMYAERELIKTKIEGIKSQLSKSDLILANSSIQQASLVTLVYFTLVFDEFNFKIVAELLHEMTNLEMLTQKEKSCVLSTLSEYDVYKVGIGDFSQTDSSSDLQLFLSKLLGYFGMCNS